MLRAPGVSDPAHYHRRLTWLAIVHPALFASAVAGIALLVWRGELFVTLAQRSNVETLTIAFFLVFFGYFLVVAAPGALGSARIGWYRLRERVARDRERIGKQREAALGERGDGSSAAFDKVIELASAPGHAWEVEIRDNVGSLGRLQFDGVRVRHLDAFRGGSNTLFGYVEDKLAELAGVEVTLVQWSSTDEEALLAYVANADALRAIGEKLGTRTWPVVTLTDDARDTLQRELAALAPALREEAFLPDWEFEGEHKLPIIPEPLGIISLTRSERRVDPLSSLTAALVVVVIVLGLLCYFIARPPWIPGH
ncbi:MAG TPA: hypothetical protein VFV99_18160 [Kofleriaceae bacterium]|nr:hypothetical protein [Kofleriaceae bacterium]